jgi:hypothetical protein
MDGSRRVSRGIVELNREIEYLFCTRPGLRHLATLARAWTTPIHALASVAASCFKVSNSTACNILLAPFRSRGRIVDWRRLEHRILDGDPTTFQSGVDQ